MPRRGWVNGVKLKVGVEYGCSTPLWVKGKGCEAKVGWQKGSLLPTHMRRNPRICVGLDECYVWQRVPRHGADISKNLQKDNFHTVRPS
ncbi:hypothetical protein PIB30_076690 [Stylosanthes scabra]|uniref:Uncharacterized protein n=1 Tax=Stylosanthes scabra TaxID=79078 RepID=A0ABU6UQD3_9FABA|nr:hypothetical protein [Stylosanthes scabra]